MRTPFLLSPSLNNTDQFSHIISTNPVAIYALPDFVQISGDNDPKLREKAMKWYKLFENDELPTKRLIPRGYQEALDKVRENRETIDLAVLAGKIGVSENILIKCLNGDVFGGKTVHLGYRDRVKLMHIQIT